MIDGHVIGFHRVGNTVVDSASFKTNAAIVWDLAIDETRNQLLVAGGGWDEDAAIEVWDLTSRTRTAHLLGHSGGATSITIRRGDTTAFSTGWDRTVIEWDLDTHSQRNRYRGSSSRLCAVAVNEESETLLAGGFDGMLHTWNISIPDIARHLKLARGEKYNAIRFSPTTDAIAAISARGFIQTFDHDQITPTRKLKGHYRVVRTIAYHPNGTWLASAGQGSEIRLWDTTTGEMLAEWKGHSSEVWDLSFSPDGATIYSVAGMWFGDGELIAWDTESGAIKHHLEGRTSTEARKGDVMRSVAASPDGSLVAFARNVNYHPGVIELLDAETFASANRLEGHDREVNSIQFHPHAPLIASGDAGGTVRIWNYVTAECLATLPRHESEITAVAFSHDGRTLASGGIDGTVHLWEPTIGNHVGSLHAKDGNLWSLDFSHDDRTLAAAMDRSLTFWKTPATTAAAPPTSPRLFPVAHPSASGRVSFMDVQWQLSWSVVQQAGLDPRWYELALHNAQSWLSEGGASSGWWRAIAIAQQQLGHDQAAANAREQIHGGK